MDRLLEGLRQNPLKSRGKLGMAIRDQVAGDLLAKDR